MSVDPIPHIVDGREPLKAWLLRNTPHSVAMIDEILGCEALINDLDDYMLLLEHFLSIGMGELFPRAVRTVADAQRVIDASLSSDE